MPILERKLTSKEKIDRFIFSWHRFQVDYWWRKKYNVPFGSYQHREMSLIDMAVEWREDMLIAEALAPKEEVIEPTKTHDGREVVRLTQAEIDEDYDNLDLSEFDKV